MSEQTLIERHGPTAVALLSTAAVALGLLLPDAFQPAGGIWVAAGILSLIAALYTRYEVLHK